MPMERQEYYYVILAELTEELLYRLHICRPFY